MDMRTITFLAIKKNLVNGLKERMGKTSFDLIDVDKVKCVGCGRCVKDCPAGCLFIENGKAEIRKTICIDCGHCYAICPTGAVTMKEHSVLEENVVSPSVIESNSLLAFMKSRRSVRQFTKETIEAEKIEMILEAGRYSPTAANAQDVSYIVLGARQQELERECVRIFRFWKKLLTPFVSIVRNIEVTDDFFFKGAPLVVVVTSKAPINAGLASSYMELMATSLELGVLYSGFFVICAKHSRKIRKILALDKGKKVVSCLVIGRTVVKYQRIPPRKKISVKTL